MLLTAKTRDASNAQQREMTPPWWINPVLYNIFFLLPFFFLTVITAGPYLFKLGQKVNNLSFENVMLGAMTIVLLAIGAAPFSFGKMKREGGVSFDLASVNKCLAIMGGISFVCHMIYFSSVFMNPELIMIFLSGDSNAMYQMRGGMADPLHWAPLGARIATHAMPCSPCYNKHGCKARTCLSALSAEDVYEN